MESELPEAIICGRVGKDEATPLKGSRIEYCDRCKSAVWMGPSTQKLHDQHRQIEVICLGCFELMDTKPEDVRPPTADQIKEIIRHFTGP